MQNDPKMDKKPDRRKRTRYRWVGCVKQGSAPSLEIREATKLAIQNKVVKGQVDDDLFRSRILVSPGTWQERQMEQKMTANWNWL